MGSDCVHCANGTKLEDGKCVSECSEGKRLSKNGECVACPIGCKECDDKKCDECIEGFQLSSDNDACEQQNPVSQRFTDKCQVYSITYFM
jgi:hypothetical protein